MIIEKVESTIITKCFKWQTDDFIEWLEKISKRLNIDTTYFIKKKWFSNQIRIVMIGLDKDVEKLEHKIKVKLLYG